MTSIEYNDIVNSLYCGHDIDFIFNGQEYFLEREDECHVLYQVIDSKTTEVVRRIAGKTLRNRVDSFLGTELFDGNSFSNIYSKVEIVDIE